MYVYAFFPNLPSIWRLDPRLEVAHEAGFPVLDRGLTPECLVECFLCMPCTYEVVQLCP